MMLNMPSIEDIKAVFVHQTCNKIEGEPSYKSINLLQRQCIHNASTLESTLGGSNNGLAGLCNFPAVYLAQTGHNFVRPLNPGDFPVYPPRTTPLQKEHIKQQFKLNKKQYDMCQRMDLLNKNLIENSMDLVWLSQIHSEEHGFGNRS
eukprot:6273629-Ditylum_brightwellii.AAC.1